MDVTKIMQKALNPADWEVNEVMQKVNPLVYYWKKAEGIPSPIEVYPDLSRGVVIFQITPVLGEDNAFEGYFQGVEITLESIPFWKATFKVIFLGRSALWGDPVVSQEWEKSGLTWNQWVKQVHQRYLHLMENMGYYLPQG
jgi:hypothetical protein